MDRIAPLRSLVPTPCFVRRYPIVVWEARHNLSILLFDRTALDDCRSLALNAAIVGTTTAVGILAP